MKSGSPAIALEELVGDDDGLHQRRAARRHVALEHGEIVRPVALAHRLDHLDRHDVVVAALRCRDSRGTAGRRGRRGRRAPAARARSRAARCEMVTPVTRMPRRAAVSAKPPQPQPISRMLSPCLAPIWARMRSYLAVCAASSDLSRLRRRRAPRSSSSSDRATGRRSCCRDRSGRGCCASSLRANCPAGDAGTSAPGCAADWCCATPPSACWFSASRAISFGRSGESQSPSM